MKLPRRRFLHLAAGAAALIALTNTTLAQDWPIRPVTMVYPFVAGSAADVLGRLFASRLSELLGQTVVFENVGGAGGMIGSNRVAKAAPDGYQFVLGGTFMVLNQALYKNRSEPGTSFAHAEKPRGTRLCPSYFARWYHGAAAARARAGARATNRFVRLALPGSEPRRQPAGPAALSPRSQRGPASAGAIRTIAELQLSPCHRRWKHRLRFHQRRAAQEGAVHLGRERQNHQQIQCPPSKREGSPCCRLLQTVPVLFQWFTMTHGNSVRHGRDIAERKNSEATMVLSLRRTGLSSPAYRDLLDYVIVEDGRDVGRLYEDRNSRPEYRWFWSITVYVDPKLVMNTSGRAATLEEAKAQFLQNWQKCQQRP